MRPSHVVWPCSWPAPELRQASTPPLPAFQSSRGIRQQAFTWSFSERNADRRVNCILQENNSLACLLFTSAVNIHQPVTALLTCRTSPPPPTHPYSHPHPHLQFPFLATFIKWLISACSLFLVLAHTTSDQSLHWEPVTSTSAATISTIRTSAQPVLALSLNHTTLFDKQSSVRLQT